MIDPIQGLRGFFQWKNGRIEKLAGYYIYDDVGIPIKIEQAKAKKEEPKSGKVSKTVSTLVALLLAATVSLSFFAVSLNNKYEKQLEKQEKILTEIAKQQKELRKQKDELEEQRNLLKKKPERGIVTFKGYTVAAGDSLSKICAENNLNYEENIGIVLAINGIENVDRIYVGQTILLPIVD